MEASKRLISAPSVDLTQHRDLPMELGSYTLLEPLGQGGMGSVYLAVHQTLKKPVAIKILPSYLLRPMEAKQRFDREILASGQLEHSAIVRATDAGHVNGTHYLVMEYINGLDLSRLSKEVGTLRIADACEITRQAALGLAYAHSQGIVHRDIKPSNGMLDENGVVKILDFGLALFDRWDAPAQELTTVGQLMGTLDYMAPEQAERSGSVDFRADLYSLGATLFRLLSGRAPLMATPNQSPLEKLRLLIHHQPCSLKTVRPDAPEGLVRLVDRLLSSDPQKRYPSATHVAEELGPFCTGSDLKGLLASAKARMRMTNSESSPVLSSIGTSPKNGSAGVSLSSPTPKTSSRSRYPWVGWAVWVACAILPFAAWAGYTILLDTKNGQLVIESDIADIKVKILRDGKPAKELSISTGAQVSKLVADRYEVTLETPSDEVSIENGSFLLRRGETVVARIRKIDRATDPSSSPPQISGDAPRVASETQPMYEGKKLDEWLDVLSSERSDARILEALLALGSLSQGSKNERIEQGVIRCLESREGLKEATLRQAFKILQSDRSNEESIQKLSLLFGKGEALLRVRILSHLNGQFVPAQGSLLKDALSSQRLAIWNPLIDAIQSAKQSDDKQRWNATIETSAFELCMKLLQQAALNHAIEETEKIVECSDLLQDIAPATWWHVGPKFESIERFQDSLRRRIANSLKSPDAQNPFSLPHSVIRLQAVRQLAFMGAGKTRRFGRNCPTGSGSVSGT